MSKIAFLYPGQGAQKAGMGQDFYEQSPLAAQLYDQAGELLGLDMKALCFQENELLDRTEYTQAALVTTCLAMTRVVKDLGLWPDVTAGLSLGEYCAIAAAGGLDELDAIRLVRRRGILMEHTVPAGRGAMSAVLSMETEKIEACIASIEGVTIANYNCPGQIVITGEAEAVRLAGEKLKEAGARRVLPLNVSGPFHSPFFIPAQKELREEFKKVEFHPLRLPYMTNVTGKLVTSIEKTPELLEKQISSPVRWMQSMEELMKTGADTFVEIGPGRTLAGFMKKIVPGVKVYAIHSWESAKEVVQELIK